MFSVHNLPPLFPGDECERLWATLTRLMSSMILICEPDVESSVAVVAEKFRRFMPIPNMGHKTRKSPNAFVKARFVLQW